MQTVLSEALGMYLAAAHELLEYFRYLRSSPSKAAALIAPASTEEAKNIKMRILAEMKAEWRMVLLLESSSVNAAELVDHCRYVGFQLPRVDGWVGEARVEGAPRGPQPTQGLVP